MKVQTRPTNRASTVAREGHGRVTLAELGPRICILGPSNSGKSTLATAIKRACGLPVVHLDQLYHHPKTDWVPREAPEFAALHDEAIAGPDWVMEGNYTRLIRPRLARATGLILLDVPTAVSLVRYLHRCWFDRDRHGALGGERDRVKWSMIRHIAGATRINRRRYRDMFDEIALPKVLIDSAMALDAFHRTNGLTR